MRKPPAGHHFCPSCGEPLADGTSHPTVTRVVRAGQRYGNDKPGTRVEVEARHIDKIVEAATMSLDELGMLEAHRNKPVEKPRSILLGMVEQGMRAAAAATRAEIERGKARAKLAAERTVERAAQAIGDLTGH